MQIPRSYTAFRRPVFDTIRARVQEPRRFIQVLAGPRQTGKTTLARQLLDAESLPSHYASADDPTLRDRAWLETQWEVGRERALRSSARSTGALLVLDEVQKIPGWSDVIKRLWDEDTASGTPLKVLILGSAPLLVQTGLTESLAGRFEVIRVTHWSYAEMRDAFGGPDSGARGTARAEAEERRIELVSRLRRGLRRLRLWDTVPTAAGHEIVPI